MKIAAGDSEIVSLLKDDPAQAELKSILEQKIN